MRQILAIGVLVLATATLGATPVPKQLPQVKGLKLGDGVQSFIGLFSSKELDSSVSGLRSFDVNPNSLPSGARRIHCDFQDNKLALLEVALSDDSRPWGALIAAPITAHGAPKTWLEISGASRLRQARLDDSAAWSDARGSTLVYGRDGTGFIIALIDSKWIPVLAPLLKGQEEQERKAAERATDSEAERKRVEQENARQAQIETQRVADEQLRQRTEEESRLRGEAESAKGEAQRARDEATALKAQTDKEHEYWDAVRAKKALQEESRAATSISPSAAGCFCARGALIAVHCHVQTNARVPVLVAVLAEARTGLLGMKSAGSKTVLVQPQSETEVQVLTKIQGGNGQDCAGCRNPTCEIQQVAIQ